MKTIQITINEPLLDSIDSQTGDGNRSAFFRQAAQLLLKQMEVRQYEQIHRKGYQRKPVLPDEFPSLL
jgi:metal-responsive CopG/Arc/MetJ family transcriptional regulator